MMNMPPKQDGSGTPDFRFKNQTPQDQMYQAQSNVPYQQPQYMPQNPQNFSPGAQYQQYNQHFQQQQPVQQYQPPPYQPYQVMQQNNNQQKRQTTPQATENKNREQKPIHTAFFSNIDYNLSHEELMSFVSQFGEIANLYSLVQKKGMAFVTYFDIRDTQKAIEQGNNQQLHGRPIHTNYAYKPPSNAKRDPRNTCDTVIVKTLSNPSKLTQADFLTALAKYGEIRNISSGDSPGTYNVQYFDLRHTQEAAKERSILIANEQVTLDYKLDEEDAKTPATPYQTQPNNMSPQYMPPMQQGNYNNPQYRQQQYRGHKGPQGAFPPQPPQPYPYQQVPNQPAYAPPGAQPAYQQGPQYYENQAAAQPPQPAAQPPYAPQYGTPPLIPQNTQPPQQLQQPRYQPDTQEALNNLKQVLGQNRG